MLNKNRQLMLHIFLSLGLFFFLFSLSNITGSENGTDDENSITNFKNIILEKAEIILTTQPAGKNTQDAYITRGTIRIKKKDARRHIVGVVYFYNNGKCSFRWPRMKLARHIIDDGEDSLYSFCTRAYRYNKSFSFKFKAFYIVGRKIFIDDNNGENYHLDLDNLVVCNLEPGFVSPIEEPVISEEHILESPNIKKVWIESKEPYLTGYFKYNPGAGKWFKDIRLPDPFPWDFPFNNSKKPIKHKVLFSAKTLYHDGSISSWSVKRKIFIDIPGTTTIKRDRFGRKKIGLNITKTGRIMLEITDKEKESKTSELRVEYIKEEIDPEEEIIINYNGLTLEIPEGALDESLQIQVTNQFEDIPPESDNVDLIGLVYRLEPHGTVFNKDFNISINYSDEHVEENHLQEKNIFIFYYDDTLKKWKYLSRAGLDTQNNIITAKCNHFSFFSAGVLSLPTEPPQAKGINTEPVNIEEIDPMAGITGIDPPTPNNQGSANISYSIKLPHGINDFTPQVRLVYNNEAKHTNAGTGWSLPVSIIEIDTSDDAAKYDGTDTLMLDGQELVPVENGVYRLMKEGVFYRIVKNGDNSFTVNKPDGTNIYYATDNNSRLYNPWNYNRIFEWFITKAVDKFGNEINYEYQEVIESGKRVNLYLNKITYGYAGAYSVNFIWEDRDDVNINCRGGFIINNNKRLKNIIAKCNNETLKSYDFVYQTGAFYKSLLIKVEETDFNGIVLNAHTFEYDTAIDSYFSESKEIPISQWSWPYSDDLKYTFTDMEIYSDNEKTRSFAYTEVDFVDINGDGLPDRVGKHRGWNTFFIQLNTGNGFTDSIEWNIPQWSWPYSDDIRYSYTFTQVDNDNDEGYSSSHTEVDFVDINGDGLPDRVGKHRGWNTFFIQLNTGNGFTDSIEWNIPQWSWPYSDDLRYTFTDMKIYSDNEKTRSFAYTEVDFVDINGDRLPDRVGKHRGWNTFFVQFNTGNGFANSDEWNIPQWSWPYSDDIRYSYTFTQVDNDNDEGYSSSHSEVGFVDINGDGLPDRVGKHRGWNTFFIQLNTGNGFTDSIEWNIPQWSWPYSDDLRYTFTDMEIYSDNEKTRSFAYTEVDFVDINGDGLPDRVGKHRGWNTFFVQFNTGNGFANSDEWNIPQWSWPYSDDIRYSYTFTQVDNDNDEGYSSSHSEVGFVDINGDGLPDRVGKHRDIDDTFFVQYNQMDHKNILTKITNTITGIEIELNYETVYLDTNRNITHNYRQKYVLSSITTGNELVRTKTDITYENGYYDRLKREFYSFENVNIDNYIIGTDTHIITERTYEIRTNGKDQYGINDKYDQYYKDLVKSEETFLNASGTDIQTNKTEYTYNENTLFEAFAGGGEDNPVKFVYPGEVRSSVFDDFGTEIGYKLSLNSFIFDDNGLIIKETSTDRNDNNTNNDDITTIKDFAVDTANWINLPYKETKTDYYDISINRKMTYYDDMPVGMISNGIVTGEELWNNTTGGINPVTSYTYDSIGNIKTITTADGLTTNFQTDHFTEPEIYKRLTKTLPDGLTEVQSFDIHGRLKKATDKTGDTIYYSYDNLDRIIEVKEELNEELKVTKIFTYSMEGEGDLFKAEALYLDDSEDEYLRAQFYRDSLGRKMQTKTESEVDGNKCWAVSGYLERDGFGRVISQGVVTKADFTISGYIDNHASSLEYSTDFAYDDFGRVIQVASPNGYTVYKSYYQGIEDNVIVFVETLSDSEERESSVYKDILEREIKTKAKKESGIYAITDFEYNLFGYGKVTESTGAIGEKQIDSLGRIQWIKTSDAGRTEYYYNDKNLISGIKKYGKTGIDIKQVDIIYGTLSRIEEIDCPGEDNDITYTYYDTTEDIDRYERGNIKSISKGNYFKTEYTFGRFWIEENKTINSSGYQTSYEYDVQGRIKELTYPDGEVVTYSYNDGGFLKSIIGNNTYISTINYDKFGQRKSVYYGNGSSVAYTYSPDTRLLDVMTTQDGDGNIILNYDYNFDISGNLEKLTDNAGGTVKSVQNYGYDKLGRIRHSDGDYLSGQSTYIRDYEFDDDNRLIVKNFENGKRYDFSYLSSTHAISRIDISGDPEGFTEIDFSYDDYGNMIKKEILKDAVVVEEYDHTYDESNRLSGFTDGVTNLSFKYDNKGQRILKIHEDEVGTIKENIYVSGFYTVSDGKVSKHISDGNYVFATKVNNEADKILYYVSNNIGSTVLLTDEDGYKVQSYLYTPFGEMWVEESHLPPEDPANEITRLFTAQEFDSETGLYYMNARYYDPHIGVFMRPDPARDCLNHYSYCGNNPIMYTDPTGLEYEYYFICQVWFEVIGGFPLIDVVSNTYEYSDTDADSVKSKRNEVVKICDKKYGRENSDVQPEGAREYNDISWEKEYSVPGIINKALKEGAIVSIIRKREIDDDKETEDKKKKKTTSEKVKEQINQDVQGSDNTGVNNSNNTSNTNTANNNSNNNSYANTGPGAGSHGEGSGGSPAPHKIICTELYRQGLMDENIYKADQEFGKYLALNKPLVMKGYHFLAKPIVNQMKKSKSFTILVHKVAMPWANEMAYRMKKRDKGDFVGKIIMAVGMVICGLVGFIITNPFYSFLIIVLLVLLFLIYKYKERIIGNILKIRYKYGDNKI